LYGGMDSIRAGALWHGTGSLYKPACSSAPLAAPRRRCPPGRSCEARVRRLLGDPGMEPRELERFRLRLESERVDANRQIAERQEDADLAIDQDEREIEAQATQSHEADVALTFAERQTNRYAAIDAALDRIARGEYGICEDCGEDIPLERLEIQPTATRDTTCQERQESGRPPTL
jgi:DnaK suppressor protein